MESTIYDSDIKRIFPVSVCDLCEAGYAIQVNSMMDAYLIEYEKTVTLCKDCYRAMGLNKIAAKPIRFEEDRFDE